MQTAIAIICGVFMSAPIIQNASGQPPATQAPGPIERQVDARQSTDEIMDGAAKESDLAVKRNLYRKGCEQVLRIASSNVVVREILNGALAAQREIKESSRANKILQNALCEARETIAFKPLIEAPLPEGFPEPTPVGEIRIKHYPEYRLARTRMSGTETGSFWTLFTHIKKKDIAMTAPVEVTYGVGGKDKFQPQTMAFLYRSTKQGSLGNDEKVDVIDVPAMKVLSIGIRGNVTKARLADAKIHLETWFKEHAKDYEASGPLRVMGYNSPFVAANQRFTEVEIPVRQTQQSRRSP